ncbi:hypothetical protein TEA_025025 [Camellia sinensis var. sinensis]|uniref:BHLH domain-containing protein n=1 Tax=Camellia sinensis var. sinensis TaxID=542762 RepID=A0A4S4E7X0_CAMSN|nr:hypothetical protein TEA_025025 [Camellia sinensis var. sinensis]
MRKMVKTLRGIVPGANQMNTVAVLDEAVRYLKSLKVVSDRRSSPGIVVPASLQIRGIPAALRDISYCYTFKLPRFGGINNRTHLSSGGDGAILVFLTGWDDISKLLEKIKANSLLRDPSKFLVLPLHSSMPTINQCEIFDRPHANVRYPSFLLRFYLLGMMVEFVKNVADFAAASGKKHIVVLSSLDFGRWQTIDMSSASMDGTDDDCERLGWKRLQEYNPEQRLWKYLSTLAEGNAELDDNMAFEDELGEEDYYPSLPFAALFSCFKAKGLKVTCLLCYCSEGDNIPEAFHLADAACSLLGLNPNNFQVSSTAFVCNVKKLCFRFGMHATSCNEGSKWIVPFSWQTVYGPPPDRSLF